MPKTNPRKARITRMIERKQLLVQRLESVLRLSDERMSSEQWTALTSRRVVLRAQVKRLMELRDRKSSDRTKRRALPRSHPFQRKPHNTLRHRMHVIETILRRAIRQNDADRFEMASDLYGMLLEETGWDWEISPPSHSKQLARVDDLLDRADVLVTMTPLERLQRLADHRRKSKQPSVRNPDYIPPRFVWADHYGKSVRSGHSRTKREKLRLVPQPCTCWLCENAHLFDEKGNLLP